MRYKHYKYHIMSFKLFNILTSFSNYINKILSEKLDIFIIAYSHNIMIYTNKKSYIALVQLIFN